ncbi:UNVERIFIED_CONTAM: Zinc finger BED domain-containing protein RICESLEEPER 1 [Sesamum radiatum]|uniref:Zinc finger BED domain-containing protein RICESLEEPER 1 n=1 Tax=Sesamum radiatum TaxID=300843 RepID=A0AAW2K9J6_SESRA
MMKLSRVGKCKGVVLKVKVLVLVEYQEADLNILNFLELVQSVQPQKSEFDMYLEESCYSFKKENKIEKIFDVLEWWRVNSVKYKVLSVMAQDILAIPITIVVSEANFSA